MESTVRAVTLLSIHPFPSAVRSQRTTVPLRNNNITAPNSYANRFANVCGANACIDSQLQRRESARSTSRNKFDFVLFPSFSYETIRRNGKQSAMESGRDLAAEVAEEETTIADKIGFKGIHHVGVLCENLERSLEFYTGILGLEPDPARPEDKLPYRGAWLWVGKEMIHLMELPNPDPLTGRPEHGGRDRHACLAVSDVGPLKAALEKAGVPYTSSKSGRPAIFTRDYDANTWEFVQLP